MWACGAQGGLSLSIECVHSQLLYGEVLERREERKGSQLPVRFVCLLRVLSYLHRKDSLGDGLE